MDSIILDNCKIALTEVWPGRMLIFFDKKYWEMVASSHLPLYSQFWECLDSPSFLSAFHIYCTHQKDRENEGGVNPFLLSCRSQDLGIGDFVKIWWPKQAFFHSVPKVKCEFSRWKGSDEWLKGNLQEESELVPPLPLFSPRWRVFSRAPPLINRIPHADGSWVPLAR